MATPRSPYVCIGDSLFNEPWPFEIKAALVLLSCHMHARWRSDRRLTLEEVAEEHPVDVEDLMKITGKRRRDAAIRSARLLAEVASISIELRGEVFYFRWPKWAEYNSTHTRSQGSLRAPPRPRPRKKEKNTSNQAGMSTHGDPKKRRSRNGAAAPRPCRRSKTPAPEDLCAEDRERVLAWARDVMPAHGDSAIEAMIDEALRYYEREGNEFSNWASAVINNITSRENWQRKRRGDPPLPSRAEAKRKREMMQKIYEQFPGTRPEAREEAQQRELKIEESA